MTIVWSLVGFALVIGILVTIHEWGHFAVARLFNVKVLTFSVGFGRPIFTLERGETVYKLGIIPLGGYVRFLDEREGPVDEALLSRAFNRQSVYKRFAIVLAGPVINLLFAWLLLSVINVFGVMSPKPIFDAPPMGSPLAQIVSDASDPVRVISLDQTSVYTWAHVQQSVLRALVAGETGMIFRAESLDGHRQYEGRLSLASLDVNDLNANWLVDLGFRPYRPLLAAIVGEVLPNSPAATIGLQSGDRLLSLDNVPVETWQAVVDFVKTRPNQQVDVRFQRGDVVFNDRLILAGVESDQVVVGQLGVKVDTNQALHEHYFYLNRMGPIDAMAAGWNKSVELTWMTLTMLKRMILGEVSFAHLSGPISIAQFSGQALQTGLVSFLGLMALLSLSLGILNLLPIPMLDGGHLMFYLFEMIRGRPLSEQAEAVSFRIGLVLIIMLTFLALTNDVIKITNG